MQVPDTLIFDLIVEHELLSKEIAEVKMKAIGVLQAATPLDLETGGPVEVRLLGTPRSELQYILDRLDELREKQSQISYERIAEKFDVSRTWVANIFQRDRW